jgi:glycosyltransferase involved in cell wall biosynthesis
MNPFFTIVLPSYNRLKSIREIFLPGLSRQDFLDYELIVVDDCSGDGTGNFFEKEIADAFPAVSPRVRYFRNAQNKGAPASRNIGAAMARSPWLYIVEDDIQIDDPWFLTKAKTIIDKMSGDVAVVCPLRLEARGEVHYRNPRNSFVRIGALSKEIYVDGTQEYSGFVENAHASSFIRTAVYNLIKEDEQLFYGNTFRDESDLYVSIREAGYRIYYCGDVLKSYHRNDLVRSGGQKKVNSLPLWRQEWMLWRNHYLFVRKHYTVPLLRTLLFSVVRLIKVFANFTRFFALKNLLALLKV